MVKVYRRGFDTSYTVEDLRNIMAILRGENGCPWDKEQDHLSIRNDLLEETYEALDAIDRLDDTDMVEELGDLLLQVVFHCQIAKEQGSFDFDTVADGICKKLIYRHPHVFSTVTVQNSDEVLDNWDKLKKDEKNQTSFTDTLKAVPKAFPALMRAQKVSKRAHKAGYDFECLSDTVLKLEEELKELKDAISSGDLSAAGDELGDLIFSAVNTARFLKVDSEEILTKSTEKFISRFEKAEKSALSKNLKLEDLTPKELDKLWEEAKKN